MAFSRGMFDDIAKTCQDTREGSQAHSDIPKAQHSRNSLISLECVDHEMTGVFSILTGLMIQITVERDHVVTDSPT